MSLLDVWMNTQSRELGRIYGVVVGIVTHNKDDDGLGRVKVKFPWLSDNDESYWARLATPMAGDNRGVYFLPEPQDEVLVAFEHGDPNFPYIIGALWNGSDKPPADNSDGKNNLRMIKSRSGHVIRLNDEENKEKIEIVDKTGHNSIIFDTANNSITITSDKDISLSAKNGAIQLEAKTIELKSSAEMKIEAQTDLSVKTGQTMTIKGSTVNIN